VPLIEPLIEDDNTETITLSNRVVIEIATASFRTTRGYSFAAVLADEVAFWRSDESSANPDVEIMRALRPGMASIPGSILLLASSPYAKKGDTTPIAATMGARRFAGFGLESANRSHERQGGQGYHCRGV
jgi:hypothetical protein